MREKVRTFELMLRRFEGVSEAEPKREPSAEILSPRSGEGSISEIYELM